VYVILEKELVMGFSSFESDARRPFENFCDPLSENQFTGPSIFIKGPDLLQK
jgi:hypothetical protein